MMAFLYSFVCFGLVFVLLPTDAQKCTEKTQFDTFDLDAMNNKLWYVVETNFPDHDRCFTYSNGDYNGTVIRSIWTKIPPGEDKLATHDEFWIHSPDSTGTILVNAKDPNFILRILEFHSDFIIYYFCKAGEPHVWVTCLDPTCHPDARNALATYGFNDVKLSYVDFKKNCPKVNA